MAFNRKAKLRDNIEALRTVFTLEKERRAATPEEREILSRYCGFGGLKFILNPAGSIMDSVHWAKSDRELFPMTVELHRLVRDNSTDEKEYKRYMDSIKSSVLTAFYTPPKSCRHLQIRSMKTALPLTAFSIRQQDRACLSLLLAPMLRRRR